MNKGCFSKIVVVICILFIMSYTLGSMFMFYKVGAEMTVLTPLVYAFFGTELCMLLVKTLLSKKMDNKKQSQQMIDDDISEE